MWDTATLDSAHRMEWPEAASYTTVGSDSNLESEKAARLGRLSFSVSQCPTISRQGTAQYNRTTSTNLK
jgi:hypothetical protein